MYHWNIVFPTNPSDRSYLGVAVLWASNCNIKSNVRIIDSDEDNTIDMCIKFCAGVEECTFFSYDVPKKVCYIKEGSSDGLEYYDGWICGFVPRRVC